MMTTAATSKTFTVTVNNVAPTLVVPANQTLVEGGLLTIDPFATLTDPGFDNPLDPIQATVETFTYAVNWGDGTSPTTGTVTRENGTAGVLSTGRFPASHTYADNGTYTVTVTVSDDDGGTTVQTLTVLVTNVVPVLTVPADQEVAEGALLNLPTLGSLTDLGFDNPVRPGGASVETFTYTVNWGDGTPIDSGSVASVSGSPGVLTTGSFGGSHTYADNGTYTVVVSVTDDDGGTINRTFRVTVGNVAPSLSVPADQTVTEGTRLDLTTLGVVTDPGFDNPNRPFGPSVESLNYSINWGDGSPIDSGAVLNRTIGSPGVLTAGTFGGSHTYADNGTYTVTVTVTDDDGAATVKTFTVVVNNAAPTLSVATNQVVNEGQFLDLPSLGAFTDPGFNNPLNPGQPTVETFTYTVNWGDGSPTESAAVPVSVGSPGVLTAGGFGNSHTYADNGVYTVTVTVTDDDGGTDIKTFTVTVNNVAPTLTQPADLVTYGREWPQLQPLGRAE
jgi:large repetitive protein